MMTALRKILVVGANDLRLLLAESGAFVVRLVVPIVFIIVIGWANGALGSSSEPPVLAVLNQDGSELSALYSAFVAGRAEGFTVADTTDIGYPDVEAAVQAVEAGEVDYLLVIPAGFGENLLSGDARVTVHQADPDPQTGTRYDAVVDAAGQRVGQLLAAERITREAVAEGDHEDQASLRQMADRTAQLAQTRTEELLAAEPVRLERQPIVLPERYELEGFRQSVPGMGSMFVMFSVLAGTGMLVQERKWWTLQRTMIAPVSRTTYLAGRLFGRFVVGMAQYVVAIATALVIGLVFGIDFGSSPLLMLAVMTAFILCAGSFSVLLSTFVSSEHQADLLTTLIAVTLAPLGGAWWSLDIEIIPDVMRKIAVVSPFYWVMEGFRAAIYDLGFSGALLPLGVLLGAAVLFLGIGALRFRVE
jgi:ABC-type Na+ efflux pump permease subunit